MSQSLFPALTSLVFPSIQGMWERVVLVHGCKCCRKQFDPHFVQVMVFPVSWPNRIGARGVGTPGAEARESRARGEVGGRRRIDWRAAARDRHFHPGKGTARQTALLFCSWFPTQANPVIFDARLEMTLTLFNSSWKFYSYFFLTARLGDELLAKKT